MRMYTFSGKHLLFGLAAILLAVSLAVCGFTVAKADRQTVSATREIPIYNVEKEEKVISLTFAAAWGLLIYSTGMILKRRFSLWANGLINTRIR